MRDVKSLFHINFPTSNWDAMVDFYVNVCGFDQAFIISAADMKNMFGQPVEEGDDKIPQITYIRVSPNSYIELWNAGLEGRKIYCDPASSFHHFSLLTNDLERTCKNMAAKGYPLFHNPLNPTPVCLEPFSPHKGEDGCLIAWMQDPDGHFIEVMQLSGNSMQEKFERENPIVD